MGQPQIAARASLALAAVSGVAVAVGVVSVAASLPWHTTYAAVSAHAMVAEAAAALALMVSGVLLWLERRRDLRSTLLVLTAAAWASGNWVGWQGGPDLVRTLGAVGHAALVPLVVHLLATTRPTPSAVVRAVRLLYAVVLAMAVLRLPVAHPRSDPSCWQNCTANVLFVGDLPVAAAVLDVASVVVSLVVGGALAIVGPWVALRGGRVARRLDAPVILAAAVFGLAVAARAGLRLSGAGETPTDERFVVIHAATAWSLFAVGVGFAHVALRSRRARRLTRALARDLAESGDRSVANLLSRAIGDPAVQVAYRVDAPEEWVDHLGRRVDAPKGGPQRGTVAVTRAGRLVAVVSHDPEAARDVDLAAALGPAARLAVENESLTAQLLARLRELEVSQARIVETADTERSRLERNLHDAAQVSVLGLTASIQRALGAARREGDPTAHDLLSRSAEEVQAAMHELRRLAHGIHPAVLDLEGLGPALESLADHSPIRVAVSAAVADRLPLAVEHTAYAVAAEVLRVAADIGEDDLDIRVARSGGWLTVRVDGTSQAPRQGVRDRVGALRGEVHRTDSGLEVRLPCE